MSPAEAASQQSHAVGDSASRERVSAVASRSAAVDVPFAGARQVSGWAASVDIVDVTRHGESVFDLKFWLACEHEAAVIVRALTGEE